MCSRVYIIRFTYKLKNIHSHKAFFINTTSKRFGVCCVFIVNTATTITQNCTYIQNPSFPNTDTAATAALTYTVARCSNGISMHIL